MLLYTSPEEEAGAIRRAVARVGCRLRSLEVRRVGATSRAVGTIDCADGWKAAELVLALAAEDRQTAGARELAARLRAVAPSDRAFAEALHRFIRTRIRFVRDRGEQFAGPSHALEIGEGDCEDQARALYAIATAGGLGAAMAFLHPRPWGQPTHAVAVLDVEGERLWAETTIAAELGEHPIEAGRRLGILSSRTDISEGVFIMSENNLPPIPSRFREVNAPEQVQRDAAALVRLGFLPSELGCLTDPSDQAFRLAVLELQRHAGIAADGLIGPQTRRAIAGMLPPDEFGMGYIAATTAATPAATPNPRMVAAWPVLLEASRALGANLNADALAIILAAATLETNIADPRSWADSHNWGAVTFNPRRGEPFVSWGYLEHGDKDREGRPVVYRFQRYPSELEGAKDQIRIKLGGGTRGQLGREEIRRAFDAGDVHAVALAMYRNGYYTALPLDTDKDGTPGTERDRVLQYARAILRHLPAARASAPPGTEFRAAPEGAIRGAVLASVLLVGTIGAAVLANR